MEPGAVTPGNEEEDASGLYAYCCFNGARGCNPWKLIMDTAITTWRAGFNGARGCNPWKQGNPAYDGLRLQALQWSQGL